MAGTVQDVASIPKGMEGSSKRSRARRPIYIAQATSYATTAAILLLYHFAGVIGAAHALIYLAAGMTWVAICLLLSELQINDRFSDQYLTVAQSLGGISIQLAAIYLTPEIGIYFVCVIFIVLSFGALRMSARDTRLVWAYAAIGLGYMLAWTDLPIGLPLNTPTERKLAFLCFVTALGRCALTGSYGNSLREMLYKRGNELKEANARIEELAQIDELTGALNRRYIMRSLNDEMARAQRSGAACAVAIIDLDFFKRINDQFGHPMGDEVLQFFSIAISANIRQIDKLGRYGGEEFLLIMPGATKEQAVLTVDRLRSIIADQNWAAISDGLGLTMSAGLTDVRQNESTDDVIARADKALYRAKEAGRNRVAVA